MSHRLSLSATKSNLLAIKEELVFAREGHELLEQKREVLVMEVMSLIEDYRNWKQEVEKNLQQAYRAYEKACMSLGEKGVRKAALALSSREEIKPKPKSIMGVMIPLLSYNRKDKPYNIYGLLGTSASLDKAVNLFTFLLPKLTKLAELEISLYRLATELKKTQRLANALSYLFIPQYRETIKFLENTLEEKEREELFQLKRTQKKS